jgi:hypothetical protein
MLRPQSGFSLGLQQYLYIALSGFGHEPVKVAREQYASLIKRLSQKTIGG